MTDAHRVAIVAHRFDSPGGIQTCFIELIAGLNEMGIVPETVWDEPQDWDAIGRPQVRTTFSSGRLMISSERLRALPLRLSKRLWLLSVRAARLSLDQFDFVYSFEPGVRMPAGVPNLCYVCGPPYLRIPREMIDTSYFGLNGTRKRLRELTTPAMGPDPNSRYVILGDWMMELWFQKFGFKPDVVWPPARSRSLPSPPHDRSGFLFFSRLTPYKRAEAMLALANASPQLKVTIAGVAQDDIYLLHLREQIRNGNLSNVEIVENPTEEQVATLLTSHEFFVYPARWEHFGIVTVEAIQAGLLPLVHDTGGQKEIVPVAELRFQSDDDLIACAKRLMDMPVQKRQQLVLSLQHHVQRGSAANYRREMLRPLQLLMDRE